MICQNCQTTVDNDLIFCTNCGERLSETKSNAQTVSFNEADFSKNSVEKPPKSSSNLKWIALIVALLAIPASLFGVYLLTNSNNQKVSQNTDKPVPVPTRKPNSNQNNNANNSNTNLADTNTNSVNANINNTNSTDQKHKIEIMNERIEVAPKSHYAKPFKIENDTATFLGKTEVLQGANFKGFVYLQYEYDNHFPNETYKMFIFGQEKRSNIKAALIPEDYVLIFVNESDKPIVIQSSFWLE